MLTQPLLVNKFFLISHRNHPGTTWNSLLLSSPLLSGRRGWHPPSQVIVETLLTLIVPHFEKPPRTRQNIILWLYTAKKHFHIHRSLKKWTKTHLFHLDSPRGSALLHATKLLFKFPFHTEEKTKGILAWSRFVFPATPPYSRDRFFSWGTNNSRVEKRIFPFSSNSWRKAIFPKVEIAWFFN